MVLKSLRFDCRLISLRALLAYFAIVASSAYGQKVEVDPGLCAMARSQGWSKETIKSLGCAENVKENITLHCAREFDEDDVKNYDLRLQALGFPSPIKKLNHVGMRWHMFVSLNTPDRDGEFSQIRVVFSKEPSLKFLAEERHTYADSNGVVLGKNEFESHVLEMMGLSSGLGSWSISVTEEFYFSDLGFDGALEISRRQLLAKLSAASANVSHVFDCSVADKSFTSPDEVFESLWIEIVEPFKKTLQNSAIKHPSKSAPDAVI